jgi:hypothetical protein
VRPIGKSFEDALANLARAKEMAATGPPEKQPPPDYSQESRGRQQMVVAGIARNEIPNKSAPVSQDSGAGFEADRERWQRQIAADGTLTPSHRLILFALSWYFNRESRIAWPSYDRLGKDTGFSRSTAFRAAWAAEGRGHVKIRRGYHPERRQCKANIYSPVFHLGETVGTDPTK